MRKSSDILLQAHRETHYAGAANSTPRACGAFIVGGDGTQAPCGQAEGDAEGAFRAIFATFNEVDHDGDVTLPGAFPIGAKIPLAGVGHNWDVPTIGGGQIGADEERAWLDGQFNLEMTLGLETYRSVGLVRR